MNPRKRQVFGDFFVPYFVELLLEIGQVKFFKMLFRNFVDGS